MTEVAPLTNPSISDGKSINVLHTINPNQNFAFLIQVRTTTTQKNRHPATRLSCPRPSACCYHQLPWSLAIFRLHATRKCLGCKPRLHTLRIASEFNLFQLTPLPHLTTKAPVFISRKPHSSFPSMKQSSIKITEPTEMGIEVIQLLFRITSFGNEQLSLTKES